MATDISNYQKSWQNNTTSYAVGSKLKIQVDFITPVTATGAVALVEIDNGKVVEATLVSGNNTTILHFEYTITSADSLASTVSFVGIVGTVKKRSGTALVVPETNIRNNGATTNSVIVTVKDAEYGAEGDGVADDSDAIQAALNSGAGMVRIPAGTYKCSKTITKPKNVRVLGDGSGVARLTWAAATYANLTSGVCFKNADADLDSLPDISNSPSRGFADTLEFVSTPDIASGDAVVIYNPTDSSWSGERSYYRAGEFVRIASVSGSSASLEWAVYDNYTPSDVDLYKLNGDSGTITGVHFEGLTDVSNATTTLSLDGVTDCTYQDIKVTGGSGRSVQLSRSFGVTFLSCIAEEDLAAQFSTDYGLIIANSQEVSVIGGRYSASRHGISTGGGDYVCSVVNREVNYINISGKQSEKFTPNLDFHGNCEFCGIYDSTVYGGATVGGNYITIRGNTFIGQSSADRVINISEAKGWHFDISDNTVHSYTGSGGSGIGMFIDARGSAPFNANTTRGGTFSCTNNKFRWLSTIAPDNDHYYISIALDGCATTEKIHILINGGSVTAVESQEFGVPAVYYDRRSGTAVIDTFTISDALFAGGGIVRLEDDTATDSPVRQFILKNVVCKDAEPGQITAWIRGVSEQIVVSDCTFNDVRELILEGSATAYCDTVEVSNCRWRDYMPNGFTGSSSQNSAVFIRYATNAIVKSNTFRQRFEKIEVDDVAPFTVGDVIVGATSTETATVYHITGSAPGELWLRDSASGTFNTTENLDIQGGASAVAAVNGASQTPSDDQTIRISSSTDAYRDHNVIIGGSAASVSVTGTDTTTL